MIHLDGYRLTNNQLWIRNYDEAIQLITGIEFDNLTDDDRIPLPELNNYYLIDDIPLLQQLLWCDYQLVGLTIDGDLYSLHTKKSVILETKIVSIHPADNSLLVHLTDDSVWVIDNQLQLTIRMAVNVSIISSIYDIEELDLRLYPSTIHYLLIDHDSNYLIIADEIEKLDGDYPSLDEIKIINNSTIVTITGEIFRLSLIDSNWQLMSYVYPEIIRDIIPINKEVGIMIIDDDNQLWKCDYDTLTLIDDIEPVKLIDVLYGTITLSCVVHYLDCDNEIQQL